MPPAGGEQVVTRRLLAALVVFGLLAGCEAGWEPEVHHGWVMDKEHRPAYDEYIGQRCVHTVSNGTLYTNGPQITTCAAYAADYERHPAEYLLIVTPCEIHDGAACPVRVVRVDRGDYARWQVGNRWDDGTGTPNELTPPTTGSAR